MAKDSYERPLCACVRARFVIGQARLVKNTQYQAILDGKLKHLSSKKLRIVVVPFHQYTFLVLSEQTLDLTEHNFCVQCYSHMHAV